MERHRANLGRLLGQEGGWLKAPPIFDHALTTRPNHEPARINTILCLLNLNRLLEARRVAQEVLQSDPHTPIDQALLRLS
jgi:tetratricopeptide (TPR) repeat protein